MAAPVFWVFSVIVLTILANSSAQEPRIVCYYTSWSVYREPNAKFDIGSSISNPCTHLIYAYAYISNENTIEPADSYSDLKMEGYTKFTGLKATNNNLKTLLSIRSDDKKSKFSPLVGDANRRQTFIQKAISYLRKYNFDGLDLNWQHPTYGNDSKPEDRGNYAQFVQELRKEFDYEYLISRQTRLLLTITVPQFADIIDQAYDIKKLNQYSDWLNVVAYNYYNASPLTTNHHAPLYEVKDEDPKLNVNFSVNHLIGAGADREKLVIGIPTYGKSYTLLNTSETGIGAPVNGSGPPGNLAYYEICQNHLGNENWTNIGSSENVTGSYLYKDDQWISYNDEVTVQKKAEYVVNEGLGGLMFWTLDMDDFRGICSSKPYPLIRAAQNGYASTKRMVKTVINRLIKKSSNMSTNDFETGFICESYGNFPHPTECNKFIYCNSTELPNSRLTPYELTCTGNLLFNEQTNNCDYPRNTNCSKVIAPGLTTMSQHTATFIPIINSSTGRSTTTTSLEDDDTEDIEDPEIIMKFIRLLKKTGSLGKLEKQLKSGTDKILIFDNTNLDKRPINTPNDSEIVNITPKVNPQVNHSDSQNQKYENLSKFDENYSRNHEEEVDSVNQDPNAVNGHDEKDKKPITINSQNNNVSWIVLFL